MGDVRLDAPYGRLEALVEATAWAARAPATRDLSAAHAGVGRAEEGASIFARKAATRTGGAQSGDRVQGVHAGAGFVASAWRAPLASIAASAARSTSFTPRPATADSASGGARLAPAASGGP